MVLIRAVEAQARIRIQQKILQKFLGQKIDGADFTYYAVPLPKCLLLVASGHPKFDQAKNVVDAGDHEAELGEGTEAQRNVFADSIWAVPASYESKEARFALNLGMTSVHLGLIPAVGKKAVVRLMWASVEIWHPANWVAEATKANADAMG